MENTYKGLKPVMACPVVGLRASLENTYKGLKQYITPIRALVTTGLENTYKGLKPESLVPIEVWRSKFGEYL